MSSDTKPSAVAFAVYNRASTREQAEEGHNLKADEDRAIEHGDRAGWTYAGSYIDAGEHGDDSERPQYRRLLDDVAAGKIAAVVIPALDRFGRDSVEIQTRLALFDRLGVRVLSLKETIDRDTPEGRLQTGILAQFAEFELAKIRARTKSGIAARARKGVPWGEGKYGYKRYERDEHGNWIPDPDERKVVEKIFSYRVERRMSYSKIARTLIAERVPTRTGGNWTPSTVKKIIENRYTRGYFTHNGEVIKGRHEAIVGEDTWLAAQVLAAEGSKFAPSRPGRRPACHVFVNGHARCGYCGEALLPRGDWYECRTNKVLRGVGSCPFPRTRREAIDEHWLTFFERVFLDLGKTREHLAAQLDADVERLDRELAAAEMEAAKVADRRARLDDDYLTGKLSAESFERFSARLTEEDAGATAERDRLRRSAEETRRTLRNVDAEEEALRRLAALRDSFVAERASGDLDALRQVSRELAEQVHFAYTTSGHLTIKGISPGDRLLVPAHDPDDENATIMSFQKDVALPLTAGIKVPGSGVPE